MRISTAVIPVATLTTLVFVSNLAMCPMPDEQQGPGDVQTPAEPPSTPPTNDELGCIDPFDSSEDCNAPQPDVRVENPCDAGYDDAYACDRPIFDLDYDDSWVANVPEFIGGYRVRYINTPKSLACSVLPIIALQTSQESLDEFLSAPLDIGSLRAAIQSIPGVPPKVRMSFSNAPFDKETHAERLRRRNENAIKRGACIQFARPPDPDLP